MHASLAHQREIERRVDVVPRRRRGLAEDVAPGRALDELMGGHGLGRVDQSQRHALEGDVLLDELDRRPSSLGRDRLGRVVVGRVPRHEVARAGPARVVAILAE